MPATATVNKVEIEQETLAWACKKTNTQINEHINSRIDEAASGDEEARIQVTYLVGLLKRRGKR